MIGDWHAGIFGRTLLLRAYRRLTGRFTRSTSDDANDGTGRPVAGLVMAGFARCASEPEKQRAVVAVLARTMSGEPLNQR